MPQLHQKTFIFPNTAYFISDSLSGILDYIESVLLDHPKCDALLAKAKWIIVEIITNAVKHSGMNEAQVKVSITENELIVERMDNGNPLRLPVHNTEAQLLWPLENMPAGTISIYEDDMHILFGEIETDGSITFFADTKNTDATSFPVANLSEHFGLLIITKSADKFTYQYDTESRTNLFTCTININI